jgi:hypothetical protein
MVLKTNISDLPRINLENNCQPSIKLLVLNQSLPRGASHCSRQVEWTLGKVSLRRHRGRSPLKFTNYVVCIILEKKGLGFHSCLGDIVYTSKTLHAIIQKKCCHVGI